MGAVVLVAGREFFSPDHSSLVVFFFGKSQREKAPPAVVLKAAHHLREQAFSNAAGAPTR